MKQNSDFRALLVPRSTAQQAPGKGGGKARAPYTGRPTAKGGQAEAAAPAAAPVRDRAAERRLGANPDYAEATPSGISLEQTKFLGGDLEHTHQVKGLDYALLQAERGRLAVSAVEAAGAEEGDAEAAEAPAHAVVVGTSHGRAALAFFAPASAQTSTALSNRFRKGATTYLFSRDATGEDDIPTTLRRAAAPTPQAQPAAGVMDALLLARIALIVKSLRIEGAGKKLRRKAVQEAPPPRVSAPPPRAAAVVDEDDDIFGDAGRDYVCAAPRRDGASEAPKPFRFDSRPAQPPSVATKAVPTRPPPQQPQPLVAKAHPAKPPAIDSEYDFYPGMAGSDDDEVPLERKGRAGKAAAESSKPAKPSLNAQVADVQRVLAEKHGDKHAVAFGEAQPAALEAPAAKRKKLAV